jgi:PAS domain S-box-containing protein
MITIWHTVRGLGPFSGAQMHQSLILLQVFMGVLGSTAMLLAAAVAQSRAAERRERDAATDLRDREQMLTLAQRAGGVATFEWNFRSQIARCSPEFFRIFGLPEGDGVMTSDVWGRFVHPDDRDRMAAHLARTLDGSETAAADYRIVRPDGRTRWLSYTGEVQRTGADERMLGTVVDITNRKQAELALGEAKTAAESANQLKDQFLATLSHELRTPLNTILGYAQMLNTNAIAAEKRQQAMEAIERNAIAQHRLVEDLLDMSRITTGKVRLNPQAIAPAAVLRDAVDGVKPAADAKGIQLTIDCDPTAGTITGDAARLQQVFWNVLTNAVKFTGTGGRIDVALRRDGDHVAAIVRDNGQGIPSEFLPFVFEAFRQADAGFDRALGGLGLGLAIAKQLVELHGGAIVVESPGSGQGATFTIRLPQRTA